MFDNILQSMENCKAMFNEALPRPWLDGVCEKTGPESDLSRNFLPESNGRWTEDGPGEGIWRPDSDFHPAKSNPESKSWGEILNKYGIDGIDFKNGEPDFRPIAEATVEIDDFSIDRADNFAQADQRIADQWKTEGKDGRADWTAREAAAYRKDNKLTWHERSDMKTMDLVPAEVHNNIPHAGGIAAKKQELA